MMREEGIVDLKWIKEKIWGILGNGDDCIEAIDYV